MQSPSFLKSTPRAACWAASTWPTACLRSSLDNRSVKYCISILDIEKYYISVEKIILRQLHRITGQIRDVACSLGLEVLVLIHTGSPVFKLAYIGLCLVPVWCPAIFTGRLLDPVFHGDCPSDSELRFRRTDTLSYCPTANWAYLITAASSYSKVHNEHLSG